MDFVLFKQIRTIPNHRLGETAFRTWRSSCLTKFYGLHQVIGINPIFLNHPIASPERIGDTKKNPSPVQHGKVQTLSDPATSPEFRYSPVTSPENSLRKRICIRTRFGLQEGSDHSGSQNDRSADVCAAIC
jgi:hypothetical protein